ncbi:unnamed protein product [Caenorhabditis brenneri]
MYDSVYLTDLDFGPNGMKVDVRPMTPSDEPKFYLEYVYGGPYKISLPQIIPGRLFTMVTLDPIQRKNGKGILRIIVKAWSNFRIQLYLCIDWTVDIQIQLYSAIIHQTGEQVLCKVDRPGVAPVSVTFVHAVANPGVRAANGTYLSTSYLGDSPLSSAIIKFEMYNADGTLPTTNVPGTTNSLETTGAYETTTQVASLEIYYIDFES